MSKRVRFQQTREVEEAGTPPAGISTVAILIPGNITMSKTCKKDTATIHRLPSDAITYGRGLTPAGTIPENDMV